MKSIGVGVTDDGQLIYIECDIDEDTVFTCSIEINAAIELRDRLTAAIQRAALALAKAGR